MIRHKKAVGIVIMLVALLDSHISIASERVPKLLGMTQQAARLLLQEQGFTFQIYERQVCGAYKVFISEQNPPPWTEEKPSFINKDTPLVLFSNSLNPVTLPNRTVSLSEQDAAKHFAKFGLKMKATYIKPKRKVGCSIATNEYSLNKQAKPLNPKPTYCYGETIQIQLEQGIKPHPESVWRQVGSRWECYIP